LDPILSQMQPISSDNTGVQLNSEPATTACRLRSGLWVSYITRNNHCMLVGGFRVTWDTLFVTRCYGQCFLIWWPAHRTSVPPRRRLYVESVPRRRHLWHESHQRLLHVLVCERLQGGGLQRGHRRVWAGVPVWARRHLRQHAGLIRLQLRTGLYGTALWDEREWVRVTSLPERRLLPRRPGNFPMRLHARWVRPPAFRPRFLFLCYLLPFFPSYFRFLFAFVQVPPYGGARGKAAPGPAQGLSVMI
jgi:hypothetical protein